MAGDGEFEWRDVLSRWWRWLGVRRVVTVVLGVPGAALVGWWLLRVPPVAIEATLPFSDAVVLPVPTSTVQASANSATAPAAAQPVIVVHVVGAVVAPGVYVLPLGSRGDDAVRAAGGALASADLARVNLAAPLTDAVQMFVPRRGESRRTPATSVPQPPSNSPIADAEAGVVANVEAGTASSVAVGTTTTGRVRLNAASAKELDVLPGVGPATAAAIVEHRRRNGPFRTIEDLDAVNGIGPARIAALRDLLVVD